jgi:hypothetical protein
MFAELFTILISIKDIKNKGLLNDYISAFGKLDKLNFPYPKLNIIFSDVNDISYLNDLKVNFNLIQKLKIEPEKEVNYYDNNVLLTILSTLPNIKDNLVHLDIKGTIKEDSKNDGFFFNNNNNNDDDDDVNMDTQDILNEFKSLRVLKLTDFEFRMYIA